MKKEADKKKMYTVGKLIKKLQELPKSRRVEVMAFDQDRCHDWEAGYSEEIKIEDSKEDKTVYIKGNIWWR